MPVALEVKNLTLMWQDICVLKDVNFTLQEGHIVSILGRSGTGKTTLFHALAGLSNPSQGTIRIEGKNTNGLPGNVGYMQQEDLLLPTKTIEDNASLAMQIAGMSKREAREIASKELKAFGLQGTETCYPHQLSGGMRQRVAFVRTYLAKKPIILADEPFSALDAITRREMQVWFVEMMRQHRLSALCITHDIEEALIMSDEIYILQGNPMQGIPSHLSAPIVIERDGKDRRAFALSKAGMCIKESILKELEQREELR